MQINPEATLRKNHTNLGHYPDLLGTFGNAQNGFLHNIEQDPRTFEAIDKHMRDSLTDLLYKSVSTSRSIVKEELRDQGYGWKPRRHWAKVMGDTLGIGYGTPVLVALLADTDIDSFDMSNQQIFFRDIGVSKNTREKAIDMYVSLPDAYSISSK